MPLRGAVFFITTNAAEAHLAARSAGGGRVLRAPPSARSVYSSSSRRHGHSVCVVESEQTQDKSHKIPCFGSCLPQKQREQEKVKNVDTHIHINYQRVFTKTNKKQTTAK